MRPSPSWNRWQRPRSSRLVDSALSTAQGATRAHSRQPAQGRRTDQGAGHVALASRPPTLTLDGATESLEVLTPEYRVGRHLQKELLKQELVLGLAADHGQGHVDDGWHAQGQAELLADGETCD